MNTYKYNKKVINTQINHNQDLYLPNKWPPGIERGPAECQAEAISFKPATFVA